MENFNSTLHWINAEIRDAILFGIVGIVIVFIALYLFRTALYMARSVQIRKLISD